MLYPEITAEHAFETGDIFIAMFAPAIRSRIRGITNLKFGNRWFGVMDP